MPLLWDRMTPISTDFDRHNDVPESAVGDGPRIILSQPRGQRSVQQIGV